MVGKPFGDAEPPVSTGTLWYALGVGDDALEVRVRLHEPPNPARFYLPKSWAGRSDYSQKLRIAGATGPNGPRFITIDRAAGEVDVEADGAEWVELHYFVDLANDSPFHAQNRHGVVLAFGPTFLALPAQQVVERTREIPIEVHAPAAWSYISTWPLVSSAPSEQDPRRRVHGHLVATSRELRDSFFATGATLRVESRMEGTENVQVGFGPTFSGPDEELADVVAQATGAYRAEFGARGPVRVYVRTGVERTEDIGGLGRRGGFVLDIPSDPGVSEKTRLLVAHEALHLWNGHGVVPRPGHEDRVRWFTEGLTHYLALKTLARTALVSESFVLAELAEAAANYVHNPLSRGRKGSTLDRHRFPYDFGLLVAFAIDTEMSRASAGQEGVREWLASVIAAADQADGYYDEDLLFSTLSAGSPPAALEVWRKHVRGGAPVRVLELFARADLHWLPEDRQRGPKLVGLDSVDPLFRTMLFQN